MNAVVVSTAEPALARTEPTTNPLIWIIFGGVVVSLVIGLILLQRATRPTS
jgi:uncharacterized protein involved in exopolysaccharide biosynthesis